MPKKPKFRPRITRIKLNPEQAVLACSCYSSGLRAGSSTEYRISGQLINVCSGKSTVFAWDSGTGIGGWAWQKVGSSSIS